MAETMMIFMGKKVTYSGLFSVKGIYRTVFTFLDEHNYGPYDAESTEEVYEEGKQITIKVKGEKKISDGAKVTWQSKFSFTRCEETIVEQEDKQLRLHKGNFVLDTEAFLKTNYDKSFNQTAWWYFIKVLLDKYVFQSYLKRAMSEAKKDYSMLESELKNYLNMESYK